MKKLVGMLILSLGVTTAANAMARLPPWADPPKAGPAAAPEIDPASAFSALTLLAGGLAVIRGRRAKRD